MHRQMGQVCHLVDHDLYPACRPLLVTFVAVKPHHGLDE